MYRTRKLNWHHTQAHDPWQFKHCSIELHAFLEEIEQTQEAVVSYVVVKHHDVEREKT